MARTKRAQILMEPVEYQKLEDIARSEDCSVAELVREAVREKYFAGTKDKQEVVKRLLSYNVPVDDDWVVIEKELEEGYDEDLRRH
jgi:hypothetical protein